MKQVAVIGGGTMVGRHAAAYHQLVCPATVLVEIDGERARRAADEFGILRVAADGRELLNCDDVDVIDICSATIRVA